MSRRAIPASRFFVKERPILFRAPMIRAILNGTKTQTRRMVKGVKLFDADYDREWHPHVLEPGGSLPTKWSWWEGPPHGPSCYHTARCPYGKPGDRLWVRETWSVDGAEALASKNPDKVWYRASEKRPEMFPRWRPSIHMPRWASRITLSIQDVRVQRLQDISEKDAAAEGVEYDQGWDTSPGDGDPGYGYLDYLSKDEAFSFTDPRKSFQSLWTKINGKTVGRRWADNPWVWAVTFKRVEP